MTIENAKIKDVTVGFDNRHTLSVRLCFESRLSSIPCNFVLANDVDVQRLKKLMEYTQVQELKDIKGRIVRLVAYGNSLRAFGDPIKDNFIPTIVKGFVEMNQEQLEKLIKRGI